MAPGHELGVAVARVIAVRVGVKPFEVIIIWSGSIAGIPGGFRLCDGSAGTPDLRDRFVEGWPLTQVGRLGTADSGGSDLRDYTHYHFNTRTGLDDPPHSHVVASGVTDFQQGGGFIPATASGGKHQHTMPGFTTGDGSTHWHLMNPTGTDTETVDTRPPYYALAYIQGPAQDAPIGSIVNYAGNVEKLFTPDIAITTLTAPLDNSSGTFDMFVDGSYTDPNSDFYDNLFVIIGTEVMQVYNTSDPSHWQMQRYDPAYWPYGGPPVDHVPGEIVYLPKWAICTGTRNTPSLDIRFAKGASGSTPVQVAGGSSQIADGTGPTHDHTAGSATIDQESDHVHSTSTFVDGDIFRVSGFDPLDLGQAFYPDDSDLGQTDATSHADTLVSATLFPNTADGPAMFNHTHFTGHPPYDPGIGYSDSSAGTAHGHGPPPTTGLDTWPSGQSIKPNCDWILFMQKQA